MAAIAPRGPAGAWAEERRGEGSDGVDGQGKTKDGEMALKAKDDFSFSFPSFREGKGSMGIVKATKLR